MATTNTRYVDPNSTTGGDGTSNSLTGAARAYVSLNAWEAARQADLVTGDIIEKVICSSDDAGSTHAADTTNVDVLGWNTDATRYIWITAASSHGGKWNDNIYRLAASNASAVLQLGDSDTIRVSGLQVHGTGNGTGNNIHCIPGTGGIFVWNCIARVDTTNTQDPYGFYTRTQNMVYFWNCIAQDFKGALGAIGFATLLSTGYFYNCTAYNCLTGFSQVSGTAVWKNCGASGCTTAFNGGTQTTCSSSTPTFVSTSGTYDLHLQSGDTTWQGQGTDLSSDANRPFGDTSITLDIDGQTRTGTWDIGADQYVATAAAVTGTFIDLVRSTASE